MKKAELAFSQVVWWIIILVLIVFVLVWFSGMRDTIGRLLDGIFG